MSSIFDSLGMDPGIIIILLLILTIVLAVNVFSSKMRISRLERLSLIHISEPTRQAEISYAVFCLKKKNKTNHK